MHIAILGATSQIARDMILSFACNKSVNLELFGRRPAAIDQWLGAVDLGNVYVGSDFALFDENKNFDAIINFIGSGNPLQTEMMGEGIYDATLKFDELVIKYLHKHQHCKYIFLSSGAAYGSSFDQPADANTTAVVPINKLTRKDWYGVAKLYAECRHRALPHLHIVDVRIFNYFSHTQDISARFLITDVVRALLSRETLFTSSENIVRDFLGPNDFYQLIDKILTATPRNCVVDCYTKKPIHKLTLFDKMRQCFGLNYEIVKESVGVNATGTKMNYFSLDRRASQFGYIPSISSLDGVINEIQLMLSS